MAECKYCGVDRSFPCRSTRDMEVETDRKECFAALVILGGGENTVNQMKAERYQRLMAKKMGVAR